jgi:hypothetical protein
MSNLDDLEAQPSRPRIRLRFSLLALLIFVTLACFLLAWFVQPNRVVATALFQVDSKKTLSLDKNAPRSLDEREFEVLKNTQLALLKSNFVLTSAIRPPGIASLPVLQGKPDPVAWLQENLDLSFPQNGEILSISLGGTESQGGDLALLVNAVAKAYHEEVIEKERARRLNDRDLLARNLEQLNSNIHRKMDDYLDISREAGRLDDGSGQVLQQLDMKRFDRVDDELMRLESSLAAGENADAAKKKSIEERIKQLKDRQAGLAKELAKRAEKSTDLETRKRELDQLQTISDEMSVRLEQLDLESSSPSQIHQVQPAVISPF